MDRRLVSGLALAAGLVVGACTEQPQEQSLQGPTSLVNLNANCNPNAFNPLIAGYFGSSQQQVVKDYKDAMFSALAANNSALALTNAFNILREIGIAAKGVPQPTAATGSELAVETLECNFDLTDEDVIEAVPTAGFFTDALSRTAGGGFDVRGGTGDPTGPVQAATGTPLLVISGIAPPAPRTATWWDESLDGQRVLFYGEPGTAGSYHWSVVPRAASFDPALVVTTCVDDALNGGDPSLMLTESGVGVLAFVDASYIGCGAAPTAMILPAGRFDLLRHLANLGRQLLVPEPAAAAVVMPGIVGGSAKTVKSEFDVDPVPTINLSVFQQPSPNPVKKGDPFTVKFQAKEPGPNGKTVNGTTISVLALNNNGTPLALFLDPPGPTPPFKCGEPGFPACAATTTSTALGHGIAEFVLSATKAGSFKLVGSGDVDLRDDQIVNGVSTNKLKVNP